jgi:hypothetical protein
LGRNFKSSEHVPGACAQQGWIAIMALRFLEGMARCMPCLDVHRTWKLQDVSGGQFDGVRCSSRAQVPMHG